MLGEAVAAALGELRAEAESTMVDACTITRAGAPGDIDEDTGTVTDGSTTTIYSGKCRLRVRDVQTNTTSAGDTEWSLGSHVLQVPISVVGVAIGDVVTVTGTLDDDLDARPFTVTAVLRGTHMSARRLALEEVS